MEENKLWRVHVVELREVECIYIVEAPDEETAEVVAINGETILEHTVGTIGITDRWTEGIELIDEK